MPTPKGGTQPRRSPAKLRAVRDDERAPVTALPPPLEPPAHLPTKAHAIWRWFCELPHIRSCCSVEHIPIIEQVVLKTMWQRRAIERVESQGGDLHRDVVGADGAIVGEDMRAECAMVLAYGKQITAELARLGLTPTDRTRVASLLADTRKANPLDEFRVR